VVTTAAQPDASGKGVHRPRNPFHDLPLSLFAAKEAAPTPALKEATAAAARQPDQASDGTRPTTAVAIGGNDPAGSSGGSSSNISGGAADAEEDEFGDADDVEVGWHGHSFDTFDPRSRFFFFFFLSHNYGCLV
jgi:hypothetical protein